MDYAGVEIPEEMQGFSCRGLLRGDQNAPRRDEQKNLYEDPAYAEVLEGLKQKFFNMKIEYKDEDSKYPELANRTTDK